MKLWPVVLLSGLAATAVMASDVSVLELAPAGTNAAIGINVRGLLDSPMAKEIKTAAAGHKGFSGLPGAPKIDGFDPFKDLDQLVVFVQSGSGKPSTLLVLTGRFDVEKMGAGAKKYHDVPLLEASQGQVLAVLDGATGIYGEQELVQQAIDRRGSGTQLGADLAARIDAARQKYDAWGLGEFPDGIAVPGEAESMFRSIDRFSFGASLRQGLELNLEAHAKSPEDASKIAAALSLLETAIKAAPKNGDGTKFEVHSDNGTFQIAVSVPQEALEAQHSALAGLFSGDMKGEGTPSPQPLVDAATAPPVAADPLAPLALESPIQAVPPAPVVPEPETPPAPKPAVPVKPSNKPVIFKAPNGDTMVLKLPGGGK
ncbi:MAG TPA: hypothetical protein VML19_10920 [Verrucomicrobiae bacterium]|nr:hypothetical protein [Verrucomicrobiae bacterium]